jgi:NADH-quinone oxidoreductase subunit J
MMLNIDIETIKSHHRRYMPFGLILVALFLGLLMVAIPAGTFKSAVETQSTSQLLNTTQQTLSNTEALGMVLYTDYLLAFEIAAVLLLVAIISAITLAHRGPRNSKRQNVRQQILVHKEQRVELVTMNTEKKY